MLLLLCNKYCYNLKKCDNFSTKIQFIQFTQTNTNINREMVNLLHLKEVGPLMPHCVFPSWPSTLLLD